MATSLQGYSRSHGATWTAGDPAAQQKAFNNTLLKVRACSTI